MKKLLSILISSKTTLVLLIVFTIAIASATFIEDKYDTITSKILVYNAKWFEVLLLLLIINFIGSIKRYQLLRRERWASLTFHIAFIIIIIGAGITRYIGYEGTMHIREGESSNYMFSSDPYISVRTGTNTFSSNKPILIGSKNDNSFSHTIYTDNNPVKIDYKKFINNAIETYHEGKGTNGEKIIEINLSSDNHQDKIILKEGAVNATHGFSLAFNTTEKPNAMVLTLHNNKVFFVYPASVEVIKMPEMISEIIQKNTLTELKPKHVYKPEGTHVAFALIKTYNNAHIQYTEGDETTSGPDVLVTTITYNGITKEVPLVGGRGYLDNFQKEKFNGKEIEISYGLKKMHLPFAIKLNKFILERYAGSNSPSSYASEVTLIDQEKAVNKNHRIFMNNVLDYGGYRFFQSSYDKDERGTILSVNHDFYGTWVSYFGYFLLGLGFVLTLFNKQSRYGKLFEKINNTRNKRKTILTIIILFINLGTVYSQNELGVNNHSHEIFTGSINKEHIKEFEELLVQTYEGRFAPVSTLAYDVMHKISRKETFNFPEREKMDALQAFLDMNINAEFWKKQKIIYVKEESVINILGQQGKYVSFNDLFNEDGSYKLAQVAETAFRKKQSEQNIFDKEIIKLNERAEVFLMVYKGDLLKVFPVQNSPNHRWISWNDSIAKQPITGSLKLLNADLKLDTFNYNSIMKEYLLSLYDATKTGDYTKPNKIISYIKSIQRQINVNTLLPTEDKIKKEVLYNKNNIFGMLKNVYALLSIVLLVLAFIENLKSKKSKIITYSLNFFIVLLALAFVFHTYGMGLRWYLSGHAPWSNGYEALILVAWASLLAGFSFLKFSKITLASTALLAFFTLMTASHSNYDPQLTNLQPVLKSYWLIIHVAVLTISYGFLGLSFLLGLINLTLFLVKKRKNSFKIMLLIKELTYVNEISMTVGLFMATIGTFLGGIWANESWGRYWGWDAKETWALVIIITYSIVLHFRLVPKIKSLYLFNVGAIIGFASILMTFFGVNYYFSKGLHSYATGETPVFPMWAWVTIFLLIGLMIFSKINDRRISKKNDFR
ncbi:MAG: cytochrome c biogenesis protein CcsA [Flavobacteriaceae bacterium]|nr:cytochrome c biogenesis protein CcsA [Flavobacteriaceae bacterium]